RGTAALGSDPPGTAPRGTAAPGTGRPGTAAPGTDPRGTGPRGTAAPGMGPRGTGPRGTGPRGTRWRGRSVMPTSKAARTLILAVVFAGALTLGYATVRALSSGVGPAPEFIAITILLGLNWSFPLLLPKATGVEALQLDEAFLVTMALVLSP